MTATTEEAATAGSAPAEGQLVTVRNRVWVVSDVARSTIAPQSMTGRPQHAVTLISIEDDARDEQLRVVWELERGAVAHDQHVLPDPVKGFDEPRQLDAFLDAVRWGAIASADKTVLQAPFRSGIKIDDYQLDPVVRALSMPRTNLLIADDVGLGKTIEAGLVMQELTLRHRARTMLIVCPAGLTLQWRDEMRDKFGLDFRIYVLRKPLPQRWWQYADKRPALRKAIANLDRVLVIALVSRLVMPAMMPTGQVFSHKLAVFATDRDSDLAVLSSAIHSSWAWHTSSTMKTDLNYSPSDVFETLVRPTATDRLGEAGKDLNAFRAAVMRRRDLGMTKLYNLVHDDSERADDIARLREIHVEIDEAVREAYALDEDLDPAIRAFEARIASAPLPSWREIDLAHGFHDTPQGPRFTISPQARTDVLDKLLALNHYRHQQELASGVLTKKKPKGRGPKASPAIQEIPALDDGTLFPPPDTLF